jgi:hypothetical protein
MRESRWIGLWTMLVSMALLLPSLAQDNKEPARKEAQNKEVEKKEPAKEEAKDPKEKPEPKKADKADPKPPEEKVVWGSELFGKLKEMDANSQKDFTIQLTYKLQEPNLDAQRQLVQQKNQLAQQQAQLAQHTFNLKRARTPDEARQVQQQLFNIKQQMASTLNSLAQTQRNLYRVKELQKDVPVRAVDNIKVRSLYPPVVYDDKGQLKAWNAKELAALKGGSRLPGYPAEYEILRPGQMVRVYLAKQAPAEKAKKKFEDEDDLPSRPEVVMIVVEREAAPAK